MTSSKLPQIGASIGGKYVVEGPLGEGGMGVVYLARHHVTNRQVAVKWVSDEKAGGNERLLREARALARISHPSVVEVLDAGEEEGGVYLVTAYAKGPSLREYAHRDPVPAPVAIDILLPVFAGVAAAHEEGIIHRDLKPENLIVCTDSSGLPTDTKVLDFGIAKMLIADDSLVLTRTGKMVGTPSYMSPEQLLGEPDVSARTDVYALGVVLYELLTGCLPYSSKKFELLSQEIIIGDLKSPQHFKPSLGPKICAVVMKALKYNVKDRYQSVAAFQEALVEFASGRVAFSALKAPAEVHVVGKKSGLPADDIPTVRIGGGGTPTIDPLSEHLHPTVTMPAGRVAHEPPLHVADTLASANLPSRTMAGSISWKKVALGATAAALLVAFGWMQGSANRVASSPPGAETDSAEKNRAKSDQAPQHTSASASASDTSASDDSVIQPASPAKKVEQAARAPSSKAPERSSPVKNPVSPRATPPRRQAPRPRSTAAPKKEESPSGVETGSGVLRASDF